MYKFLTHTQWGGIFLLCHDNTLEVVDKPIEWDTTMMSIGWTKYMKFDETILAEYFIPYKNGMDTKGARYYIKLHGTMN